MRAMRPRAAKVLTNPSPKKPAPSGFEAFDERAERPRSTQGRGFPFFFVFREDCFQRHLALENLTRTFAWSGVNPFVILATMDARLHGTLKGAHSG